MAEATNTPTTPAFLQRGLDQIPGVRQLLLLVGIAASVAVGVALALWTREAPMRPLFPGLDRSEVMAVAGALDSMQIEHRIDASGALLVPAERLQEAQLRLAEQGLPNSAGISIDSLYQGAGMGTSQFMESKFYLHALENRLGGIIAGMMAVKSAEVSLGLPKRSAFVRDRRSPSASVLVHLYPGRNLQPAQVHGITHLVASSVPELDASDVTVLDQRGDLLTPESGTDGMALAASQLEFRHHVEEAMTSKVLALLEPIMGAGRARAEVDAQLDFSQTEQTSETFDPQSQVVRSEQRNTDERTGPVDALGVPGALSNQPPGVVGASVTVAAGVAGAEGVTQEPAVPVTRREDLVRNYEVDRTISRVRGSVGEVQRLSVAVLLDYLPGADGGEPAPLSDAQLADVNALVREAVGFDEARGDTINIINTRFQPVAMEEPPPAPPLWEQPWVLGIGKLALGAVAVLLVVLAVLRPLISALMRSHATAVSAAQQRLEGPVLEAAQLTQHDPLLLAKDLADNDPRRVAQVVKGWVGTDE